VSARRSPEEWVHEHVPRRLRRRLSQLNRFRWVHKAGLARRAGASVLRQPLTVLGFVLLDPEVDTYTYDLDNQDLQVSFVAGSLGITYERASELLREAKSDPVLTAEITRRVRWRLDFKRRVWFGRRYAWYALARELKPRLIVETGIKDGLGSVLLTRALERNAEEGHPGKLLAFDLYPDKGWLVPERLRRWWEPIFEGTDVALEPALEGREVGLFINDSVTSYDFARFEFEVALRHAAPRIALVAGSAHHSNALGEICREVGVPYHYFADRPRRHIHPGAATAVGIVDRAKLKRRRR